MCSLADGSSVDAPQRPPVYSPDVQNHTNVKGSNHSICFVKIIGTSVHLNTLEFRSLAKLQVDKELCRRDWAFTKLLVNAQLQNYRVCALEKYQLNLKSCKR